MANQITHRSTFHHTRLADHLTPYDTGTVQIIDVLTVSLASRGLPPGVAEDSALKRLEGTVTRQATMIAYNDVLWMMEGMFLLCLPFLLLLGGRSRGQAAATAS